tara:strand:- start:444 stop:692 length:249 start_codon:yes stop_codon:yes gene_type:complete
MFVKDAAKKWADTPVCLSFETGAATVAGFRQRLRLFVFTPSTWLIAAQMPFVRSRVDFASDIRARLRGKQGPDFRSFADVRT